MKKVLVIAGPTASGKTALSVRLAEKYSCEIISGDSIQVYRGMDIGSGKVTVEEMHGIRHYLIDILSPTEEYSVRDFQTMAREIIDESDRIKIICGGTGLYLKSCLYDYVFREEEGPSADPLLEELSNVIRSILKFCTENTILAKLNRENCGQNMQNRFILQNSI